MPILCGGLDPVHCRINNLFVFNSSLSPTLIKSIRAGDDRKPPDKNGSKSIKMSGADAKTNEEIFIETKGQLLATGEAEQ